MTGLRARLDRFGIQAKKRLGQNFLHDEQALAAIAARVDRHDPVGVLEIGPGPASLTDHLVRLDRPLVVVERDPELVRLLESHLAGARAVTIVEGDFLAFDPASAFPGARPVVVGNIPYNISTPILLHLLGARGSIGPAILMLQAELAERLRAPVGTRAAGSLTVLLALLAEVERVLRLKPGAFTPPPKVSSEVIELRWRDRPLEEVSSVAAFERLVRAGFGQRRKTLRNALKSVFQPEDIAAAAARAGVSLDRRAEALTLEAWAALERALAQRAR